eukprot:9479926-Pyramimonas_sp.AAC.4
MVQRGSERIRRTFSDAKLAAAGEAEAYAVWATGATGVGAAAEVAVAVPPMSGAGTANKATVTLSLLISLSASQPLSLRGMERTAAAPEGLGALRLSTRHSAPRWERKAPHTAQRWLHTHTNLDHHNSHTKAPLQTAALPQPITRGANPLQRGFARPGRGALVYE